MSLMLVNPYRFAAGGGGGGDTTHVQLTSDQAFGGASATASWPTPVVDGLGAWSAGNPTRLTIPTTGYYVVYANAAIISSTSGLTVSDMRQLRVNGALVKGFGVTASSKGTALGVASGRSVSSNPILLTSGDYVELYCEGTSATLDGDGVYKTAMWLHQLSATPEIAIVEITSNRTAINGSHTPSWDAELTDTDGLWDSGAPTVFTMNKSAYASAVLTCRQSGIGGSNFSGGRILKNGAAVFSVGRQGYDGAGQDLHVIGGPIPVANTDTISSQITSIDTSWDFLAAGSSFGVEVHQDDCAQATLSSNITAVDADTSPPYWITWTSESFDDDGFFTTGSGQRMTCSSAGTYQIGANIWIDSLRNFAQNGLFVTVERYNSSGTLLDSYHETWCNLGNLAEVYCVTPRIECASGDYFRAGIEIVGDSSVTILTTSKFWLRRFA